MDCPYCRYEMASGRVYGGNGLIWHADGAEEEYFVHQEKSTELWLGDFPSLPCYYCKSCNLLLAHPKLKPRGLEHSIARAKDATTKFVKKLKKEDF